MSEIIANESGLDARTTLNTALQSDVVLSTTNVGGFDDGRVLVDSASVTWDRSTPGEISAAATGSGSAPANAEYLVGALSGALSAERVPTNTTTITWDFGTAAQAKANAVIGGGSGIAPDNATYIVQTTTTDLSAERALTDTASIVWDFSTGSQAKATVNPNLAVGFTGTATNLGTITTGTVTPDPATGQYKRYVNGGAHTLAPPSIGSGDSTDVVVQITNNGSAGSITTSGFTKVTGSAFDTTNGNDFMCYLTRCNGFSLLNVVALQ